jgi:hypothetical protein
MPPEVYQLPIMSKNFLHAIRIFHALIHYFFRRFLGGGGLEDS